MENPNTVKKELIDFFNDKVKSKYHKSNDSFSRSFVDYYFIKQDNSTLLTISSTTDKTTSSRGALRSIFAVQPTSLQSPKLLTQVTSIRGVRIEETPIAVESEKYTSGIILLVHISFDFILLRTNNLQDQLENIFPKFLRKRSKVASLLDGSFCNYELLVKKKLLRVMKRRSRPKEGITLFKNSLDLNRFIYLRKVPQSLYPDFASPEYPVSIYCGSKPEDKNALVGLSEDLKGFNIIVGMQDENRISLIQNLITQLRKKYNRILVIDPESVLNNLNTLEHTFFYRFGVNIARNILNYTNLSNEERSSRLTNSLLNSIRNNSYYHYFFRIISLFQLQDKLLGPGNYSFMSMAEEMQESTLSKAGFKDQRSSDEISALFTSFGNWDEFSSHQGGEKLEEDEPGLFIIQFNQKHPEFCVKLAIDYLLEEYHNKYEAIILLSAEKVIHPWKDPEKISIQNESTLKSLKKISRTSPIFICSRELTVISLERSFSINNAIFMKVNQRTKENIINSYAMNVAQNERYKIDSPSELLSFLDKFALLFRFDAPNVPFVFTPLKFPQISQIPSKLEVDFEPVELKTTLIFSKRISSDKLGLSCFILHLSNYGIHEEQIEEQIKSEWPEKIEISVIHRILDHLDSVGYLVKDSIQGIKYSITDRGKEFLDENDFNKVSLSYSTLLESEEVAYQEILEKIDINDFIGIKTSIRNLLGSLIKKENVLGKKFYLLSIFKRIEELGDAQVYQERYRDLMLAIKGFIDFSQDKDLLMAPDWTIKINKFFTDLNFPKYPITGLLSLFLNQNASDNEDSELDKILDQAYEDNIVEVTETSESISSNGGE